MRPNYNRRAEWWRAVEVTAWIVLGVIVTLFALWFSGAVLPTAGGRVEAPTTTVAPDSAFIPASAPLVYYPPVTVSQFNS